MLERFSGQRLIIGLAILIIFGIALSLRVVFPFDDVFAGDWIKFVGVDSYYHMRLVDNMVANFPFGNSIDPFMQYRVVWGIGRFWFFDFLLAGIIWLVGLGSPSPDTVNVVSVYFPAVLGALTVVPVYLIGKAIFNKFTGIIAALLVAILPGEFLGRTLLGRTDHHSIEVILTTFLMLFFILAIIEARKRQLTTKQLWKPEWSSITKPLIYSVISGIFLGIYLITWSGALLFVFILFIYFIIQFIVDHVKGKDTFYLAFTGLVTFIITTIILISFPYQKIYLAAVVIAMLTPVLLAVISGLMNRFDIKRMVYPFTLIGAGVIGILLFRIIAPALFNSLISKFSNVIPMGIELSVEEAQPLLFPAGSFSLLVAWGQFTTGFYISLIALGILIYLNIKSGDVDKTAIIVWSLIILAASLSMRRFTYYYAVNVALLTGYFCWLIVYFLVQRRQKTQPETVPVQSKKKSKSKKVTERRTLFYNKRLAMALAAVIIFFLAIFPNIGTAIRTADNPRVVPDDGWMESLDWLRDNTPEPFNDPDLYYAKYEQPFHYPESTYAIAAWWDYGYWIVRIGRRLPSCNPGNEHMRSQVAKLFLAQDENTAARIIAELNSKYVIADYETVLLKLPALIQYAGVSESAFYDMYYKPEGSDFIGEYYFYPEFYQTLAVRLYNFNGEEYIPDDVTVISYEMARIKGGQEIRVITDIESFTDYQAAVDYIDSQGSGNYRIVGESAFDSPVPLDALEHCNLVFSSEDKVILPNTPNIPKVKIFESMP